MTRKFRKRHEMGFGPRDRVFDTNHEYSCNDPIVARVISWFVPLHLRSSKYLDGFICSWFHSEQHSNRRDPEQSLFRCEMANAFIGADHRSEKDRFLAEEATAEELDRFDAEYLKTEEMTRHNRNVVALGRMRIAKEKADF